MLLHRAPSLLSICLARSRSSSSSSVVALAALAQHLIHISDSQDSFVEFFLSPLEEEEEEIGVQGLTVGA